MTDGREPKVSFRAPPALIGAMEDMAERQSVPVAEVWRRAGWLAVESHPEIADEVDDELRLAAEIDRERDRIKDRARPVDLAGGFPGRVRSDFEDRFKSGYLPKMLAAKAASYVEEARMLEQKVPEHPDAPDMQEGELVEEVERVVREVVNAANLSNWFDRYDSNFHRFEGVQDGQDRRRFALVLTKNAMRLDADIETLRSTTASERRVAGDDLPELAEEELPHGLDRDDVADAARRLADMGHDPEDVPTDPQEFDPFGWGGPDATVAADTPRLISADGSGALPAPSEPVEDDTDDEPEEEEETDPLTEAVEWAAQELREKAHSYRDDREDWWNRDAARKKRREAEELIATAVESGKFADMDHDLTPDTLIELAHDYNDERDRALRGERDDLPTVEAGNGGVSLD